MAFSYVFPSSGHAIPDYSFQHQVVDEKILQGHGDKVFLGASHQLFSVNHRRYA